MPGPSPTIVLYTKHDCDPCAEARVLLRALLEERAAAGVAAPPVEEREIAADPAWIAAFRHEVPVVEIGERRLPFATSAARLRRFLAEALDPVPA